MIETIKKMIRIDKNGAPCYSKPSRINLCGWREFAVEYKVFQKEINLQSRGWIPTFHDVSKEVKEIVAMSGVRNGTVTVASHHTTCSVMVQECSHDIDSFDLEYLQHDLLDIMRRLIPLTLNRSTNTAIRDRPCAIRPLCERAGRLYEQNTDGHLRSVFFGRSEVLTIKDGEVDGGEFAHIYFVDWDQVRARPRQLNVTVMGTTEDVEDRSFHGGAVIDTKRKYTQEEKQYMEQFDLQQKR